MLEKIESEGSYYGGERLSKQTANTNSKPVGCLPSALVLK